MTSKKQDHNPVTSRKRDLWKQPFVFSLEFCIYPLKTRSLSRYFEKRNGFFSVFFMFKKLPFGFSIKKIFFCYLKNIWSLLHYLQKTIFSFFVIMINWQSSWNLVISASIHGCHYFYVLFSQDLILITK